MILPKGAKGMSSKKGTLWPAPPHTIAKIEMLGKYLRVWFEILARRFPGRDLWYIDGFAGPGEYTDYPDGSPVAAMKAADEALRVVGSSAGNVHCVFIEEDRKRFEHLEARLDREKTSDRIKRHPIRGTFVEGMARVRALNPNPFVANAPTFAFLDPFGPEGLPFQLIKELLGRQACEVLVNLDSDGIDRINRAGGWANHRELLNETFGDSGWERELAGITQTNVAITKIVDLYKRRLRALPNVDYCYSFEMRGKKAFDYHLVFASQHHRGLEKMKEVMKQIDQTGAYSFSDGNVDQHILFREDDLDTYLEKMARHLAGQRVTWKAANDFALNETIFTNARRILSALEKAGRIDVSTPYSKRRRYTFPDESHEGMYIQFREEAHAEKI